MTALSSSPVGAAFLPRAAAIVARSVRALRAALDRHQRRRQALHDLRTLHAMDAHELRDIGLLRADLPPLPAALPLGDDGRAWYRLPR
jgi:uncharacterized protein YjiS (DUF1127 family)